MEEKKNISLLIQKYGGTPTSIDVNDEFFVIQLRLGLLFYNRETDNVFFYKKKDIPLFQLKGDLIIIYDEDNKKISINKIIEKERTIQEIKEIKIDSEYFGKLIYFDNKVFFVDFGENILYVYSIDQPSKFIRKQLEKDINVSNFYLEDVYMDKLLLISEDKEEIKIVEYNLKNNKHTFLNLGLCMKELFKHDVFVNDQCNYNKPICSLLRYDEKGNIIILYVFKTKLMIKKIMV